MQELIVKEVFIQFSEAMYTWNIKAIEMDKEKLPHNVLFEKKGADLIEIFDKYVTKRKRVYGDPSSRNVRNPPEYNPATNEIISCTVEDKKAYIEVQETVGFKLKLKYTLHKKKEGWLVDKREVYRKFENKWEVISL
jgi:hypothetical protein